MNKELTELVFILDRSGSMAGLEDDIIGGFNGMIKRQKAEGEQVNVTTVLFDDQIDMIHDRFSIDVVEPLTSEDYYVRGCTALLDAVGTSIKKIENVQNHLPEDHKAARVVFVITTDGHENSSREYSYPKIKNMIEAKKELGWDFIFLGANIDSVKEAGRMGIAGNSVANYTNDSEGIATNYEAISDVIREASKSRSEKCCRSESIEVVREKAEKRRKSRNSSTANDD